MLLSVTACKQNTGGDTTKPTSITIKCDSEEVAELDILVGSEKQLSATVLPSDAPQLVTWTSSNSSIVSVDEDGKIKGIDDGTAIISAVSQNYSNIEKKLFVNVTSLAEQKGVGSGKSKDDPIFIGNEGKSEPLEIYFLETYHIYADSLYIKKGNVDIVIDSGYAFDGSVNREFINSKVTDGRVDLLMASHSDGDHIDGFKNLMSDIDYVSTIIDYGGGHPNSGEYKSMINEYVSGGAKYYTAIDCVKNQNEAVKRWYLTSEFYVDVLNTGAYSSSGLSVGNAESLATIFYYKDFSFFTGGDLTTGSEATLLKNEVLPNVTLYKASHHGSHGSNSQELLNALNPKGVAITASRAGTYGATPSLTPNPSVTTNLNAASGHPALNAIERIYKAPSISSNLNVYWNAVNGTMKFSTTGSNSFKFSGSPTKRGYYDLSLTNNQPVWNDTIMDFENKVTGEENKKLHETKAFVFRDYVKYLPKWAQDEYYPNYYK